MTSKATSGIAEVPPEERPDVDEYREEDALKGAPEDGKNARATRAIVWVGGLGGSSEESLQDVGRHVAIACDQNAVNGLTRWSIRWNPSREDVGGDQGPRPEPNPERRPADATVLRQDGSTDPLPVVDIFHYSWAGDMLGGWRAQSPFRRFMKAAFALLGVVRLRRFFRYTKGTPKGRLQIFVAGIFVAVIAAYTLLVGAALLVTMGDAIRNEPSGQQEEPSAGEQPPEGSVATPPPGQAAAPSGELEAGEGGASVEDETRDDPVQVGLWQWLVLAFAAAERSLRAFKPREKITAAGDVLLAGRGYIDVLEGQDEAVGDLRHLLEEIRTRGYEQVSVVSYSFGTIVAIDTLFPRSETPPTSISVVDQLITIGAPYAYVQALRSDWLAGRIGLAGTPNAWFNVYQPSDLLGSPIEPPAGWLTVDGDNGGGLVVKNIPWDRGIRVSVPNALQMYGVENHAQYWKKTHATAVTNEPRTGTGVFNQVVQLLYAGTPALGEPGNT